jgi:hypothetical protein
MRFGKDTRLKTYEVALLEFATLLPQGAILNVAGGKSELKGGSKGGKN